MPDIGWYGLVLVIAAVATAALTVPAKRIALRVGYVAHPGERTVHTKPIPYGGGASMFLGFMVAVLGAAAVLAAPTQGPISTVVLMMELTGRDRSFIVPLLLAVATATLVARTIEPRSIYDARLTDEEVAARQKARELPAR